MKNQYTTVRCIIIMIFLGGLTTLLITWVAAVADASSPNRLTRAQPSLSKSFIVSKDAFVSSGFPGDAHGKLPGLLVGRSSRPTSSIHPYEIAQMLLEYDVGEIAGAEVLEATLRLYFVYYESIGSGGSPVDLSLWTVMQTWEESTITWSSRPSTSITSVTTMSAGVEFNRWIDIPIPAEVVKDWAEHPGQNHGLLINAPSVESSGGQVRNYLSKEYGAGEFAPQLIVTYRPPPTPTPTPTFTPTPTPGTHYLSLSNHPTGPLESGEPVTYTIEVMNGAFPLSSVSITNSVPGELVVLSESISRGSLSWSYQVHGQRITWTLDQTLPPNARDQLHYQAARPTPALSATPTMLTLTKFGPQAVAPGELITYTLYVTTPTTMLAPVIINSGACVRWEYAVTGEPFQTGVQCSGPTFNPLRAQWLPFVNR